MLIDIKTDVQRRTSAFYGHFANCKNKGLLDDSDRSEEENGLSDTLTSVNDSDDLAYEYEDIPGPAYERDDGTAETEQEQYKSLIAVEF